LAKDKEINLCRDDVEYLRIEKYQVHELRLATLFEVMIRLRKVEEPKIYNIGTYNLAELDLEYYIDCIIAKANYNKRTTKDNEKKLIISHVITNIINSKNYLIRGLEYLLDNIDNDKYKKNLFGFLSKDINTIEDLIIKHSGIINKDAINYAIGLFQLPRTIIKPQYLHDGIDLLQQYNSKLYIELDITEPKELQKKYFLDLINDIYKEYNRDLALPLQIIDELLLSITNIIKIDTDLDIEKRKNKAKSLQMALADKFFIYDANKKNMQMEDIIGDKNKTGILNEYYLDYKEIPDISEKTFKKYLSEIKKLINELTVESEEMR